MADNQLDEYFEIQQRRTADKPRRVYVDLQPGESTLANMASRIYAARLGNGSVSPGEEEGAMRASVMEAIRIAQLVEHWVDDAAEKK